jgi:hypothetical protein
MNRLILLMVALAAAAATTLIGSSSAVAWCNPDYADCESPLTSTSAPDSGLHQVARTPGGVHVRGYAIDPDTTGPIDARVQIDGVETGTVTADDFYVSNVLRLVFPGHGDYHGLDDVAPARAGSRVCVEPVDFDENGAPADPPLAGTPSCLGFAVGVDPSGALEALERDADFVRVRGWAFDPDRAEGIRVQIFHDGGLAATTPTTLPRPDVVPPGHMGYGVAHGFDVAVPKGPGRHLVCVFAKNEGAGLPSSFLGCRSYGPPIAPSVTAEPDTWMGHREVRIRWTDNADDEAGYVVERRQPDGSWTAVAPSTGPMAGAGGSASVTSAGLAPDAEYCFRVRTWNAFGEASAQKCTRTRVAPPPTSLVSFSVSPGPVQTCNTVDVTISWSVISARRVVVRRNGVVIQNPTPPAPMDGEWKHSYTDKSRAESTLTYRLELYGYDGKLAAAVVRTVSKPVPPGTVTVVLGESPPGDRHNRRGFSVALPGCAGISDAARITSVTNVSRDIWGIPIAIRLTHSGSGTAELGPGAGTSAFNGLAATASWTAFVPNISAVFLDPSPKPPFGSPPPNAVFTTPMAARIAVVVAWAVP